MHRMRFRSVLAITVFGMTLATVAEGQQAGAQGGAQPPRPQARQEQRRPQGAGGANAPRRGPGGPGGAAGRGNPAALLLRMRGPLALSPEQVKRLEALAETPMPKIDRANQLRAQADLVEAMQGDGNLAAARTAMDKMAKLRTDRMIAGLKARQEARAVLTPSQKAKVDNLRKRLGARAGKGRMRQRQGGMMRGGMMRGGPGARGGMPNAGGARREIIEERVIRGPDGEERVIRQGPARPPVPPV